MYFNEKALFKRIKTCETWRDLRVLFKNVKKVWRKTYVTAFLCHLDNLELRSLTNKEKEILNEFIEDIKDQPEGM